MSIFSHASLRGARFLQGLVVILTLVALPPESAHAEWDNGFRLSVHAGFTSNSSTNLRKDGNNNILKSSDVASPAFGVTFLYGLDRFDLGLSVDHFGSGSFQGFNAKRPLGGKARFATTFNWHYVKSTWGSMYVGVTPGVVFIQHTDHLRSQIATSLGRQPTQIEGIDKHNIGFAFGTSIGLLFELGDTIAMVLEAHLVVSDATMQDDSEQLEYLSTQPVIRMGLTAQL
jgi:hypothetical protein